MSVWDEYPQDYRASEVRAITSAAQVGECVSVAGLSGSGKSNLLGYVANRVTLPGMRFVLLDCNRLTEHTRALDSIPTAPKNILRLSQSEDACSSR